MDGMGQNWLGLPSGVKFDPTDQELIEHLEAKVETKNNIMKMKSHPLIDEFIPTIEGEDGICYTHPEKLPGVTRDGLSKHFFHRPSKAYTTGTRKRRKIQSECCDLQSVGETRWHKTGKTRAVLVNGKQKGCKKILVLYTNFGKNRKPEKTNWVMHQYHLGQHEEEKEGELVVSKIFYQTQPRQCIWSTERINNNNHNRSEATSNNGEMNNSAGSGSSSSKEIVTNQTVQMSPPITNFTAALMDIHHQFKIDHFSFFPFTKTFHEVGIGEASNSREVSGSCEVVEAHDNNNNINQQQQQIATAAFHISRPSHPISTVITPPPLHHASLVLDDNNPYHHQVMLPNDHFQQQQHDKLSLEELIMGCTSSTDNDNVKQESSSITNPQEAEWLKYSSYWPDPHNPHHHAHV